MLASMVPELQKQFEDMEAFDILAQLQAMFGKQARIERFDTVKAILDSRLKRAIKGVIGSGIVQNTLRTRRMVMSLLLQVFML